MRDDRAALISQGVIPSFEGTNNFDEIQSRFIEAAKKIMFEHDLVRGNCRWTITALELYLYTGSEIWRDCTTHRSPQQLKSGYWYVHQYENGNWHPPNRSGIDLTVGSEGQNTYGGMLIRQICMRGGPGVAFKRILREPFGFCYRRRKWTDDEREHIECIHDHSVSSDALRLERIQTERRGSICIGPRIGLNCKAYAQAPLRVWVKPGAQT